LKLGLQARDGAWWRFDESVRAIFVLPRGALHEQIASAPWMERNAEGGGESGEGVAPFYTSSQLPGRSAGCLARPAAPCPDGQLIGTRAGTEMTNQYLQWFTIRLGRRAMPLKALVERIGLDCPRSNALKRLGEGQCNAAGGPSRDQAAKRVSYQTSVKPATRSISVISNVNIRGL
jgi:hypothetical protein